MKRIYAAVCGAALWSARAAVSLFMLAAFDIELRRDGKSRGVGGRHAGQVGL